MEVVKVTKEMLQAGRDGEVLYGAVLIQSYTSGTTKSGKEYLFGTIVAGVEMQFKVWNNSAAFQKMKAEEYQNCVSWIRATFNNYNGSMSLIIEDVLAISDFAVSDFLISRYNIESYWMHLRSLVQKECSAAGYELACKVLFDNEDLAPRFQNEFAASGIHDNCRGGLLAHTYKVVHFVVQSCNIYPSLVAGGSSRKDLLILGALFHDIGKTVEMHLGVYQPATVVTHRFLGIEFVPKDLVVAYYDEAWYYELVSIFLQHHGEYDDKCRSVAAMVVHLADCYESKMMYLTQLLESPINGPDGAKVKMDGNYLYIGGRSNE